MEKKTARQAPAVLLFGLAGERGRGWSEAAEKLRVRVRHVLPAEYGLPLWRVLAGGPAEPTAPLAALPEPMLVMAGFSRELLDAYLREARAAGAARVALKAVLTQTNAGWSARQLYDELSWEHEAMGRGGAGTDRQKSG